MPIKKIQRENGTFRYAHYSEQEGRTVQSDADGCDINKIMARTMPIARINTKQPMYGDFSEVGDFNSALNAVRAAEDMFLALPVKVRVRFEHDPAKLIQFVKDPNNKAEALELGIVDEPEKSDQDEPSQPDVPAAPIVVPTGGE